MIQPGKARRRGILVVAYAVLAISCGDSLSPGDTDVDHVDVTPSAVALTVGETRTITAQVFDAGGAQLLNRRVFWTTQDATVATVSQSGVITGTGSGNTQIAASAGGKSGLVGVSVNARPVSLVRIVPPTATVQSGVTITLAAEALDASGAEVIGRPVAWASSNSAIASVSAAGQVTGVAPGTATITATIDGIPGTATVTVTDVPAASVRISPPSGTVQQGGALQLTATALDAKGAELPGRIATWTSSNESVATVSSTGRVVGIAEGSFTITARMDGVSGTGTYTVTKIPVGLVTVSPTNVTLSVGQTQPMTVSLFAADRTTPLPIAGRTIAWSSSNTSVVSVSTAGVVTGVSSGSATITATTEGVSGTATVNVTAVPIASISVTPSSATVVEGGTTTLVATALDGGGNVLAGRTIFWSSSNPQVSVSQIGVVTAVVNSAPQSATITASAPGGGAGGTTPSATASVSVTYAPVAVASLAPPTQTITVSQTTTFALALQDAVGQSLTTAGRTISWQSLNPAIVTVNPTTGAVTGVAQGGPVGIEVSASSPGQATPARDTGFVTVSNVPVASVTVTPNPATVHVGAAYSRTFTAVTRDASGNVLSGRSIVWISLDQSKATVDPTSGVVTGAGLGSATIRATSEGVNGDAAVTVDLVAIDSVAVSPAAVTLSPGATQVLSWVARDSAGNGVTGTALGGRTPSWSSSNTGVATVSGAGVVTAVAQGNATVTAMIGTSKPGASAVTVVTPVNSVDLIATSDSLILPGTLPGLVTVLDAGSAALSGRTVTFSSAPSGLVAVTPSPATSDANGQVAVTITGVAPGTTTITATSEGKTDAVSVRVLAGISSIALTPSADSIIGTGVLGLTATATGASGALAGRPLTVVSSNPAALTASPSTATNTNGSGQVAITLTAVAPGNSTVSVTSLEGASVSRVVRVLAPVDHVVISAPGDSVLGTGTLQATATAFDASNNPLPGRLVTWQAAGDATVDANGLITGVTAPGSASVTATSEGKVAALLVRVLVGVASVTVGAPDSTVFVTETQQAFAIPRDANSNPITGRVITWQSSDPAIANVSSTGLITAIAPGSVTITATVPAEGKSGSMPFSVSLIPADSVAVAPLNPQASQGSSINFTATVFAAGNVLTGRTVTWSSSDASLLTIDPNTGVAQVKNKAGTVTVTATTTPGTGSGNTAIGTSIVTIP